MTTRPLAQDQLMLYGKVLEDIRLRAVEVERLLGQSLKVHNSHVASYAALQLRTMIELVVMSSLVAHKHSVESVGKAFAKKGADEAAKLVKRANPEYWPRPVRLEFPGNEPFDGTLYDDGTEIRLAPVTEGFLREADWRSEWGFLSMLLHAANPYAVSPATPHPDISDHFVRLHSVYERVVSLLARHQILLPGEEVLVTGQLQANDGRVHVQLALRRDDRA